jgi:hypothetical protein
MQFGFAKSDITPRVGVELSGFGPFLNRRSIAVRDRLWARAMAVCEGDRTIIVNSNDIIGVNRETAARVRQLVTDATGVPGEAVMVHCTHTHSGPATGTYSGWGETDLPYIELLPDRIAAACIQAVQNLQEATASHAEVPCEGVGLNREYDIDSPPLEEVLSDDWRPAKPELTDTTCHVITVHSGDALLGFASYFGCHPVVCCSQSRYIHGDYAGVATNLLEREHPGSIGLFLQGAQGDVNSCVVHKSEQESLLALDVIAGRYARAVRPGIAQAQPLEAEGLAWALQEVAFTRKQMSLDDLRAALAEQEAIIHAPGATDESREVRMAMVNTLAYRKLIAMAAAGQSLAPPTEVQGLRIGPIALLGSPFETFQAIKNEVHEKAHSPLPLMMGVTNDTPGYAPDHTAAARGGYAADVVPLILGSLPYANIHDELVASLLDVEAKLY